MAKMSGIAKDSIDAIRSRLAYHETRLWEAISIENALRMKLQEFETKLKQLNYENVKPATAEKSNISLFIRSIDQLMTEYEIKLWECIEDKIEFEENFTIFVNNDDVLDGSIAACIKNERPIETICATSEDYSLALNYVEIKLEENNDNVERTKLSKMAHTTGAAIEKKAIKYPHSAIENLLRLTSDNAATENVLRCDVCQKTFTNKRNLANHREVHNNTIYPCNICAQKFYTRNQLRYHRRQHVDILMDKSCYECRLCTEDFNMLITLKVHMFNIHNNAKPFDCSQCDQLFDDPNKFKSHQLSHVGSYECYMCHKTLANRHYLKRHLKFHWYGSPNKCPDCNKMFVNIVHMQNHIKIFHLGEGIPKDHLCNECGKGFSSNYRLTAHMRSHTGEKPFHCEYCQKRFSVSSSLKLHLKIHLNDTSKIFACDICQKTFPQERGLKQHKNRHIHRQTRRYCCDLCQRKFVDASNLKSHMRTHSGQKLHKCPECSQSLTTAASLKAHIDRMHSLHDQNEERPHKCPNCNRGFFGKTQLNLHMIEHTGVKPYPCTECDSRFKTAGQLKTHQLTVHCDERPYKCDQCESAFKHMHLLRRHKRVHTGEKPYSCEICNARFADFSYVAIHMRTHTGEKPFLCNVCSKTFIDPRNLKKHMKMHQN